MLYPYLTLANDIEVLHSHLITVDGKPTVEVHFEQANDKGFCEARCILPNYKWIKKINFSDEDIAFFQVFLQNNAHLIFQYAESGGLQIA